MNAIIHRIFAVVATLALLVSLAACGGNGSVADDSGASPPDGGDSDTGSASSQSDAPPPVSPPTDSGGETPSESEPPPNQMTANEARSVLRDWLAGHPIAPPDVLSAEYGERDVGGEAYYLFSLDNMEMYWANFLVHKQTGDLLFMMVSDGEEPDTYTMPLGDWYGEYYGDGGYRDVVAYVRLDPSETAGGAWLLIDELLWINGDDIETLAKYGIDEDDVNNDYVIINEVEEWVSHTAADNAVFRVEFNQGDYDEWFNRRELGREEFMAYVAYVMENFYDGAVLADVTIDGNGSVTRVAERYVP
jgi:predicted small lipoprotein YifL